MDQLPDKIDISNIFKRLRSIPFNKVCFDCGAKNPTWASVTYGVFICMDCSAVHRSLGVHLSFVRSTQLDTNWTWLQLRAMQVGGNSNAQAFFQHHNITTSDAQQKYNGRVANLYREKLHHMASSAMRVHGTKPIIDLNTVEQTHSPEPKEVDFFQEHSTIEQESSNGNLSVPVKPAPPIQSSQSRSPGLEPKVDHVSNLSSNDMTKIMERKTILHKPAKKGLGAKRGLGAQRIATDFKSIEQEAEQLQSMKQKAAETLAPQVEAPNEEEESKNLTSMRLAYQDLGLQQKQAENKVREMNPQKAEQMERLGMGFTSSQSSTITHSAMSDMKIINQTPPAHKSQSKNKDFSLEEDYDFFGFSVGPPKYGDSPFLSYTEDKMDKKYGSWEKSTTKPKKPQTFENEEAPTRKKTSYSKPATSDEAQKLFGNAKSISSSQFFNNDKGSEPERRAHLSKFEASSSISSAEYFGKPSAVPDTNVPNLYDIKEGVKGGVTKVAGRLSNIASGVISSIQDRYGY